mmetsp:Transcript_12914/g.24399  ORF Transcript_12914/g.24399 Transcript_12914/m.24399 type:complete len:368 (-) Transcript_12914:94-1197(-)
MACSAVLVVLLCITGHHVDAEHEVGEDEVALLQTQINSNIHMGTKASGAHSKRTPRTEQNQSGQMLLQQSSQFPVRPDCFVHTGGTCMVQACSASRGPTNCTAIGRCLCQPGYCSGADGRCYQGPYKLLLDNFTIRNYRWKHMYVYAAADSSGFTHKLKVSSDNTSLRTRFRLYQMPDGAVLLYNMAYPDYANHVERDKDKQHQAIPTGIGGEIPVAGHKLHHFKTGLVDIRVSGLLSSHPEAGAPTLDVLKPPGGEAKFNSTGGAIMLGSHKFTHRYIYVPGMSYTLEMYYDDPGDGALWVFDPPLPADFPLKEFKGDACAFACTGAGSFELKICKFLGLVFAGLLLYGFSCFYMPSFLKRVEDWK